jgi:hypothetical protein
MRYSDSERDLDFQQAYTVPGGSVGFAGGNEAPGLALSTEGRAAQATGCRNVS